MSNIKTGKVNLKVMLQFPAFGLGFKDFCRGAPFKDLQDLHEAYNYERGRLIAAAIRSEGLEPSTFLPIKSNLEILALLYKKVDHYANPHARLDAGAYDRAIEKLKSAAPTGMNLL